MEEEQTKKHLLVNKDSLDYLKKVELIDAIRQARVSASNFVALDTDKKLKTLSEYQFFIQNRTNCRK
ncbi:hypothetical protein COO91_02799 [Nostoc flagelliforme CCNUN1]|uniref:Uncharacterized protein n=2 Tax=Nostoc flagelliforme TaxID=1306274 RepID=A0A2K8SN19_9NOSO|nr:hypothetical protein COO91_02799 [Nostoc flagelliforme CCNUN1]